MFYSYCIDTFDTGLVNRQCWGHDYSEGRSNANFRGHRGKSNLLHPLKLAIERPCINLKMFELPVAAPINKNMSN
ncbi:hypothetical protein TSAR_015046 [Trichomalopsis sarcophagae]|uniref:Uncharacterized protein n=1 Tax=Trichomalopsis sarcophagae TaxID=543379 RepID=A0A232F9C8_9HYME|nr:hypothetical protein TSAR_015046 [Trichomalopsis sarcophagae]